MKTTRADKADGIEGAIEPDISPSRQTVPRGVTLRDVASRAGANKSSVSVVLNGSRSNTGVSAAMRERILITAREMGYEANPHAQRLARGRCNKTVALFPALLDVGLHTRQLLMIQHLLSEQGYSVPIYARDASVGSQ